MSSAIMRSVVTPARERAGRPPDGAPHGARAVLPLALGQAPSKHKAPLWTWFIGLSVEERERVVCIEDRTAVTLLRQMYQKRARDGEGLFFNVDDQPSEPSAEPCFSRLRRLAHLCAYPDFLLRADRQLEDAIRMCDTQQYLDTITIEASLLRDPSEIYRLFMIATRGGFLSAPCKVSYVEGRWVWQKPAWFVHMGFYSLATFIAHKLEQALWMRYWEAIRVDPRAAPAHRDYEFPTYHKGLLTKAHLYRFWHAATPPERKRIVGSLRSIVNEVLGQAADTAAAPAALVLDGVQLGRPQSPLHVDAARAVLVLKTLVDITHAERSLEALLFDASSAALKARSPPEELSRRFIDVLYFTPLCIAGSPLDLVLRRIGIRVSAEYTQSCRMDLILGEEERAKRGAKGKKGRGAGAGAGLGGAKSKAKKKHYGHARRDAAPSRARDLQAAHAAAHAPPSPSPSPSPVAAAPPALSGKKKAASMPLMGSASAPSAAAASSAADVARGKREKKTRAALSPPPKQPEPEPEVAAANVEAEHEAEAEAEAEADADAETATGEGEANAGADAAVGESEAVVEAEAETVTVETAVEPEAAKEAAAEETVTTEAAEETATAEAEPAVEEPTVEEAAVEEAAVEEAAVEEAAVEEEAEPEAEATQQQRETEQSPTTVRGSEAAEREAAAASAAASGLAEGAWERTAGSEALGDSEGGGGSARADEAADDLASSSSASTRVIEAADEAVDEAALLTPHSEASDDLSYSSETATPDPYPDDDDDAATPPPRPRRLSLSLSSERDLSDDARRPATARHQRTRSSTDGSEQRPRPEPAPLSASAPGTPVGRGDARAKKKKRKAPGHAPTSPAAAAAAALSGGGGGGGSGKRGVDLKCSNPASKALSELAASAELSPRHPPPEHPPPAPEALRRRAFAVRLHDEILEFVQVAKGMVVRELAPKAESMTRRVETLVRLLWPGASVRVYGSLGAHLALPSSDLDLVVIGARSAPDGTSAFEVLVRELKQQPWVYVGSFQPIASAKIPVIKLISTVEKLPTDITFCDPLVAPAAAPPAAPILPSPHHGLRACELIKSFALAFHPLTPLALVLKQMLYERGLSNTYGGGLSSYCLVLLIVSFLQTCVPQKECERIYEKTSARNLGDLLLRFLDLYGRRFAYQSTGVAVTDGGRHFPLADQPMWRTHGPPPLVLLDPFDAANNIAASAFGMHRVRAAFDFSYAVMTAAADSAGDGSPLSLVLRSWQRAQNGNGRGSLPMPALLGRDANAVPHRANFTS